MSTQLDLTAAPDAVLNDSRSLATAFPNAPLGFRVLVKSGPDDPGRVWERSRVTWIPLILAKRKARR